MAVSLFPTSVPSSVEKTHLQVARDLGNINVSCQLYLAESRKLVETVQKFGTAANFSALERQVEAIKIIYIDCLKKAQAFDQDFFYEMSSDETLIKAFDSTQFTAFGAAERIEKGGSGKDLERITGIQAFVKEYLPKSSSFKPK